MKIIDGEKISKSILSKIKSEISTRNIHPRLDIIYIGQSFASDLYVEKKRKQAEEVGIEVVVHNYDKITHEEVKSLISNLNNDKNVNGIMIQLPFKVEGATQREVMNQIDPRKDVDGLTSTSLGGVWQKYNIGFAPATALGTLECIKHVAIFSDNEYSSEELSESFVEGEVKKFLEGKNVVIINHSNIVGKPIAGILLNYNATITIAHKYTKNLKNLTKNADILISGTGISNFITKDMVKENSILIDIGINKSAEGVGGDMNFEQVKDIASWITPVPGGVGPLTVAMLLRNTLRAFKS